MCAADAASEPRALRNAGSRVRPVADGPPGHPPRPRGSQAGGRARGLSRMRAAESQTASSMANIPMAIEARHAVASSGRTAQPEPVAPVAWTVAGTTADGTTLTPARNA